MLPRKISSESLFKKLENLEDILLVDVRAEEKYNEYHIKSSSIEYLNIPKVNIFKLEEQENSTVSLPKDKEIIVTCTTGNSATKCANILSEQGYNVKVLDGGITAWKEFTGE